MLISLLLLGCSINFAKPCESDIFTIVNDNSLQRKMKSSSNEVNAENYFDASTSRLYKFFSLSIEELTELTTLKKEQMKENILSLPSVYINLLENTPAMFYDVKYSQYYNFEDLSETSETVKIDSHAGTVDIIYEAKLTELIINGKAEVNGTCHDFILNITEPVLGAVHKKQNSNFNGALPNSILESFSYKSYYLIIESNTSMSTENLIIGSPNSQILPQLAASWLVRIFNAVNARFIKPKIMRHNRLLFKTSKDTILKNFAVSVANEINKLPQNSVITKEETVIDDNYNNGYVHKNEYRFEDIWVYNFEHFQADCSSSSQSVFLSSKSNGVDNLYSHHIDLVFTKPWFGITATPTVQYSSSTRQKDRYNNYYNNNNENRGKNFIQHFIQQWSVKFLVFTDRNGYLVNDYEMKIKVDFELINMFNSLDDSLKANRTMFIESFEKLMAERLVTYIKSSEPSSFTKFPNTELTTAYI